MPATLIKESLEIIKWRLKQAAVAVQRDPTSLCLIAVSKTFSISAIKAAYQAGCQNFGENYVQEFKEKAERLGHLNITWHFIGPLQSNKTHTVAQYAQWVHTIDRLKIAQRLSDQRPPSLPPLNVCIQVNVSAEPSKSGCTVADAVLLAHQVAVLPHVTLRGLMCIPDPSANPPDLAHQFGQLQALQQELSLNKVTVDVLSMGMSDDLEIAIAQGATHLRVGRAIFGVRAENNCPTRSDQ